MKLLYRTGPDLSLHIGKGFVLFACLLQAGVICCYPTSLKLCRYLSIPPTDAFHCVNHKLIKFFAKQKILLSVLSVFICFILSSVFYSLQFLCVFPASRQLRSHFVLSFVVSICIQFFCVILCVYSSV